MESIEERLGKLSEEQRALFEKMLAERQAREGTIEVPQLEPDPEARNEPFPLTDIQQAQWFGRSGLFDITVAGHGYVELDCDGMDLERIQTALRRIINDNDQMRMVVCPNLQQRVLETVPEYQIEVYDLRDLEESEAEKGLMEIRERMAHEILPADQWPIFEVCASRRSGDRLRIHFSFDLLVGDAWCFRMLIDEWARVYEDLDGGRKPPEQLRYRDYALALQDMETGELAERDLAYWREQLVDLPPAPQLPQALSLAQLEQVRSEHWSIRLDADQWSRLKKKLAREHLTASGFFAAALSEVITLWNKEPRHALNVTVFNRLPIHPDVEKILVGEFNSFLLLAVENGMDAPFAERARTLQSLLWQHLEHRWVSGVRLMRELAQMRGTGSGESLMPVVFTSTLAHHENEDNIPTRTLGEWTYEVSQTPQVWMEHHLWEENGELLLHIDVVDGLFPAGMMADFAAAYDKLIHTLAREDEAWQARNGHYLLPESHRLAWEDYNRTEDVRLPRGFLNSGFEARVLQQPEAPAVITASSTLTYADLDAEANRLAHRLLEVGVAPNDLVALMLPKGPQQVIAALGVLKAGAAYLPLDADAPEARLRGILVDAGVEVMVSASAINSEYQWPDGLEVIDLDDQTLESQPATTPRPRHKEDDLAYVIYTSGSTGKPKGVMIDHRGAVNTINDVNQRIDLQPSDRIFAVSALSFDLSVYDLFGALSAGAAIIMPDRQAPDPKQWYELVGEYRATVWNSVPALMEMLLIYAEEHGLALPDSLRCGLMSGDWIPLSLPDRLSLAAPQLRMISLGGATEASIWSIYYPITEVRLDWPSIPYGMPLKNQTIHVLNSFLEPCPFWVSGDIYIGGVGLAKGYWRDEEKTAASFIEHPVTGERLYRTGDLGRLVPEGYVEFLGRADNQVKVRGYRIELGEIEGTLNLLDGIQGAVVTVTGDTSETRQLSAFVVPEEGEQWSPEALSQALQERLPQYMIPATFTLLDQFPLTANGKVDRNRLTELADQDESSAPAYVAPGTATEERVAALWCELLDVEKVGIHDNFFQLGGNSLIASRLLYHLHDVFEVELPLAQLFEATTVAALAELIEKQIMAEVEAMSEDEVEETLS